MGAENSVANNPYPTKNYPQVPFGKQGWTVGDVVDQVNTCSPVYLDNAGRTVPDKCYFSGEWKALPPKTVTNCCYISAGDNKGVEFLPPGSCSGCSCEGCDGGCLFKGIGEPMEVPVLLPPSGPIQCQLVKYMADPIECAFTGTNPQLKKGETREVKTPLGPITVKDPDVLLSCDPEVLPGGAKNVATIKNFCAIGTNFINDPRCFAFCTKEKNDCTDLVNTYCVEDALNLETCKKYCFSSQTNYDCGVQLASHCANEINRSTDLCNCFLPTEVYETYYAGILGEKASNVTEVIAALNKVPYCSYTPCAGSTFKPRNIQPCPDQAICYNNIQFNADGEIYFDGDLNFRQSCEQVFGNGTYASNPPPTSFPIWLILVIAAAVIVGLVAIVVGIVYGTRKKKV